jgi:hypothetical protein
LNYNQKLKERNHVVGLDENGRIILKWIFGLDAAGLEYGAVVGSCNTV